MLSKIFERIVIIRYAEKYDTFDPNQSSYRSGFSTQTALLRICDDVRWGIEGGCVTILVLFDFSKAFDTIPHILLLKKLKSLRFFNADSTWICSYLTDRSRLLLVMTVSFRIGYLQLRVSHRDRSLVRCSFIFSVHCGYMK